MSDLKINNLSIDLLQDTATIALFREDAPRAGRSNFTAVNIQVPIEDSGHQVEEQLRRSALSAAKRTLEEAIRALNNHDA